MLQAYSQALRLRRICSNDSDFFRHTQELKGRLVARGHSYRQVQRSVNRARSIPRSLALKEKTPRAEPIQRVPLITTFHPSLPPLRKITTDNHHILHTSDRLASAVPDTPLLAYRRPRNLRDLIVRAKVPPLDTPSPSQHGTFKCDSNRCVVWQHHVNKSDVLYGHSSRCSGLANPACQLLRANSTDE